MNIGLILQNRYSNHEWALVGNPTTKAEFDEALTWLGAEPKPSWTEVSGQWASVEAEIAINTIKRKRQADYVATTDSLFFKYQAGEATEQEWLEARALVANKNPYPNT